MRQPAAFTLTNLLRNGDGEALTELASFVVHRFCPRVAWLSLVSQIIGHFYAKQSRRRRRHRRRHWEHSLTSCIFLLPFRGLTLGWTKNSIPCHTHIGRVHFWAARRRSIHHTKMMQNIVQNLRRFPPNFFRHQ
jgi:hypothetical protein